MTIAGHGRETQPPTIDEATRTSLDSSASGENDRADRWAGLLATSSELVVIQRHDLSTGYISPSVENLLGVTPDQLVRNWTEIVHPDDVGTVRGLSFDGPWDRSLASLASPTRRLARRTS